jgi:hypothetical protein
MGAIKSPADAVRAAIVAFDERGKPGVRAKLKHMKWGLQNGKCAECGG